MTEGIQVLTIVLPVVTTVTLSVFFIVSYITNGDSRQYYKRTYDAIKSGQYVLATDSSSHNTRMKYFVPPQYVDEYWYCREQVVLFYEKGKPDAIKLLSRGNHYIHNYGFPMIDFYARYWFKKIVKVMNEQEISMRIDMRRNVVVPFEIANFKFLR